MPSSCASMHRCTRTRLWMRLPSMLSASTLTWWAVCRGAAALLHVHYLHYHPAQTLQLRCSQSQGCRQTLHSHLMPCDPAAGRHWSTRCSRAGRRPCGRTCSLCRACRSTSISRPYMRLLACCGCCSLQRSEGCNRQIRQRWPCPNVPPLTDLLANVRLDDKASGAWSSILYWFRMHSVWFHQLTLWRQSKIKVLSAFISDP
jgi:hypothetical protein